jgi:hypothetical protein
MGPVTFLTPAEAAANGPDQRHADQSGVGSLAGAFGRGDVDGRIRLRFVMAGTIQHNPGSHRRRAMSDLRPVVPNPRTLSRQKRIDHSYLKTLEIGDVSSGHAEVDDARRRRGFPPRFFQREAA